MNQFAFDRNHAALIRLLAHLMVYLGLAADMRDAMSAKDRWARGLHALAEPGAISRRLHRIVHALLGPVEAATRRLIVMFVETLPEFKLCKLRSVRSGQAGKPRGPSSSPARPPRFRLDDALQQFSTQIGTFPSGVDRFVADPAKAIEQVSDVPLLRRVTALAHALDNVPLHARRLARWRARQALKTFGRWSPFRPGYPPGWPGRRTPKSRWREEHHVLRDTNDFARETIRRLNSS